MLVLGLGFRAHGYQRFVQVDMGVVLKVHGKGGTIGGFRVLDGFRFRRGS